MGISKRQTGERSGPCERSPTGIYSYTLIVLREEDNMQIVKIRKVGNSNVVTLPRALESIGFEVGANVILEELSNGVVMLVPASNVRERIRALGRQVIVEDEEALELLASHDRGEGALVDSGE